MPDIEIATAFEKIFYPKIVRILGRPLSAQEPPCQGTGCIIGHVLNPDYKPKALVATAGHLLKSQYPVEWTLERFDLSNKTSRKVTFQITPQNPKGPKAFYYGADPRLDIGAMFVDSDCVDGQPFLELDDTENPTEPLLPLIDPQRGFGPGSRVAWAGFPASVESYLGFPKICYYEGVIAAMIDTKNYPPLYLLDGHNTAGVSGAPLWSYNDDSSRTELIGIVVSYLSDVQKKLPGFACATPIHPLIRYLESLKPSPRL